MPHLRLCCLYWHIGASIWDCLEALFCLTIQGGLGLSKVDSVARTIVEEIEAVTLLGFLLNVINDALLSAESPLFPRFDRLDWLELKKRPNENGTYFGSQS